MRSNRSQEGKSPALEAMIKSGGLDCLGAPRWVLLSALDDALRAAEQSADNKAAGMGDLFGDVVFPRPPVATPTKIIVARALRYCAMYWQAKKRA